MCAHSSVTESTTSSWGEATPPLRIASTSCPRRQKVVEIRGTLIDRSPRSHSSPLQDVKAYECADGTLPPPSLADIEHVLQGRIADSVSLVLHSYDPPM